VAIDNAYHVLEFQPALDAEGLPPALEQLAQQWVASGLLRIHTDYERNYVLYSGSSYDKSFSRRELTDPKLWPATQQIIRDTLPGMMGGGTEEEVYARLMRKLRTGGEITEQREMQIARLLVQSTHPAVLMLALMEGVQCFVSYSHSIGELMPIHFWESEGQNQGMQRISGDGTAVYVSCGGDPFVTKDEQKHYTTDGFPALARLLVIAAQEWGHYADIRRNAHGQRMGRHSASMVPLRAEFGVREARLQDLQIVGRLQQWAAFFQLPALISQERSERFYRKHRPARAWWMRRHTQQAMSHLERRALAEEVHFFSIFPHHLLPEGARATQMAECLNDMAVNLSPQAEVYRRKDSVQEEAIACIEALARVPQQVVKWGHTVTQACWPNLYRIYYGQVIPNVIQAVEGVTGRPFDQLVPPQAYNRAGQRRTTRSAFAFLRRTWTPKAP